MRWSGSRVRLRYAGIVLFFSKVFSIFTGLIFVLLITRQLPIEQYGLWRMINNYLAYMLLFANVYSYWLPRTMARGVNTAKTGLILSLSLGSTVTLIYVVLASWLSASFNQPFTILLMVSPQVILYYVQRAIEAVSSGYAPQFNGYALIIFELIKVGVSVSLVLYFQVGLLGAILAVICAQTASILFSIILNYKVITHSKWDFNITRSWLRQSWLPIFSAGTGVLAVLDVILVRIITGSTQPIAYYGVALTLAGVVANANVMASALYPRLIAKADMADTKAIVRLVYMFAIPIAIFLVFYANPVTAVFGLGYLVASNTVRVAAMASLLSIFSSLLDTIILGIEKRDAENLTFRNIANSMLLKLPLINYLNVLLNFALLSLVLSSVTGEVEASFRWAITSTISYLVAIISKMIVLQKRTNIQIRALAGVIKSLIYYFTSSVCATFIIFNVFQVVPGAKISDLLFSLVPPFILATVIYFALIFIIDKDVRDLLQAIIMELRSRS